MARSFILVALTAVITGCQTVHTATVGGQLHGDVEEMPIAVWMALSQFTEDEKEVRPTIAEKITDVLKDNGLRATVDEKGVAVPDDETKRAYVALMTDRRLAESGIKVLFISSAGEANRTPNGSEITAPRRVPTTFQSNPKE